MKTTITKWGNSQGIKIPEAILKDIHLKENDSVDITLENEKIIIKKINVKEHKTLEERLIEFYGENYMDYAKIDEEEIDWGKPVGEEFW